MRIPLSLKQKARYLAHTTTAANWYCNTQCTEEQPWGPVHNLADEGRFVYEVFKGSRWSRGAGVWAQALAIMDLIDVATRTGNGKYKQAALKGARYLLSLQCLDFRYPECQGAFWEHVPTDPISLVRDGATGCFSLAYLYAATGENEYLERARLFCDWYMKYGAKKEHCWPYMLFDFTSRKGHSTSSSDPGVDKSAAKELIDGDWQAGGGLALYYTGLLSGEKKYLEEGLRPMLEKVVRIYDQYGDQPALAGWHGESPVTYGNDDFVLIALMAGFRLWKDERYLKHIRNRTRAHLDWMAEDGSYPNFGATFVCSIEHLEYLKLAQEYGFSEHTEDVKAALEKSAQFGLTLQERELNDPMYYGGLYGQTSYGVERDRIHQRDVGYSINFYLKLEGELWPRTLTSYGWGKM